MHGGTTSHAEDAAFSRGEWALVAGVAVALTAGVVAETLSTAPSEDRVLAAIVHGLLVATPATVGLAALHRRPDDRFARLLVVAGLLWASTGLATSQDEILYSIGRVAVWLVEPMLVYLLLAFPSGRLTTTAERRVFASALLLALVLYLPTALVARDYPVPTPWSTCGVHCPHNGLALTNSTPGLVDDVVRPLRETLTVLVFAAVAAVLARRAAASGPLLRRALSPVVATAAFRALAIAAYFAARSGERTSGTLDVLGWIYVLSLPMVAAAFGAGLVLRSLYAATALERLALRLRAHAGAAELRAAMADALEDPSLRIVYWRTGEPGRWVAENGWPVEAPQRTRRRDVTEITSDGRRVAAITHDATLDQDPALMQAAASYALAVLENSRLLSRLRASARELSHSRARIVAGADEARRRIERDLHDGAQQRLVALRIKLSQQGERLRETDPPAAASLTALAQDVEDTIDEVRALARGIYPALLAERGLGDALRAAARGAPIPTSVDSDGVGRYAPDIESTVYFACVEALQNAAKHARGASHVVITLAADGPLAFQIRDDGEGFDDSVGAGAGLGNLRDRLTAVGGDVRIESRPGEGTRVTGTVPVGRSSG